MNSLPPRSARFAIAAEATRQSAPGSSVPSGLLAAAPASAVPDDENSVMEIEQRPPPSAVSAGAVPAAAPSDPPGEDSDSDVVVEETPQRRGQKAHRCEELADDPVAGDTRCLSAEPLEALGCFDPKYEPGEVERRLKVGLKREFINSYAVPGVLFHRRGTISQFENSVGLAPMASDSCETFSTVMGVLLAALKDSSRFFRGIPQSAINYLIFSSSWMHQITSPAWSRGGKQRRPTVRDVAESLHLADAVPSVEVRPDDFVALAYTNRGLADALVDKLVLYPEHPDAVRGYVIVAGDYAVSVAGLFRRDEGRLVSHALVLSDSHGELPWAENFACCSVVRCRSAQYDQWHRKTRPDAAVDSLPSLSDGLAHFKRVLFAFLEHCRRVHGQDSAWSRKYSTWVPIVERTAFRPQPGTPAEKLYLSLYDHGVTRVLKESRAARESFSRTAANVELRHGATIRKFMCYADDSPGGRPVGPVSMWGTVLSTIDTPADIEANLRVPFVGDAQAPEVASKQPTQQPSTTPVKATPSVPASGDSPMPAPPARPAVESATEASGPTAASPSKSRSGRGTPQLAATAGALDPFEKPGVARRIIATKPKAAAVEVETAAAAQPARGVTPAMFLKQRSASAPLSGSSPSSPADNPAGTKTKRAPGSSPFATVPLADQRRMLAGAKSLPGASATLPPLAAMFNASYGASPGRSREDDPPLGGPAASSASRIGAPVATPLAPKMPVGRPKVPPTPPATMVGDMLPKDPPRRLNASGSKRPPLSQAAKSAPRKGQMTLSESFARRAAPAPPSPLPDTGAANPEDRQ